MIKKIDVICFELCCVWQLCTVITHVYEQFYS